MKFKTVWPSLVLATLGQSIAFSQVHFISPLNESVPAVWNESDQMPEHEKWRSMYELAEDIADDYNSGGTKYQIKYKKNGGSSYQTLVYGPEGDIKGIWSAPNHATYLLGEIFAFNIARVLGRSSWSTPAVRMTFMDLGRDKIETVIRSTTPEVNKELSQTLGRSRRCNRDTQLAYLKHNQNFINGAFMYFVPGVSPKKVPELVDRTQGSQYGRLNKAHFLVKMLNGRLNPTGNPVYFIPSRSRQKFTYERPGAGTVYYTSTDTELTRQLSFMTIVDSLNSQRDRFGPIGSNMEVMINKNDGSVALTLVDNGGLSTSYWDLASMRTFVGRNGENVATKVFEKDVYDRVLALDEFLNGVEGEKSPQFLNYESETEFQMALGYEVNQPLSGEDKAALAEWTKPYSCKYDHRFLFNWNERWENRYLKFKQGLKKVADHMRKHPNFI